MPLIHHKTEANYRVAIWHTTESIEELKAILSTPTTLQHINADSLSPKQQVERVTSHILIKHLLNAPYKVEKHPNGAPYIAAPNTHISISHTQHYVAVAISTQPIGVDIEMRGAKQHNVIARILNSNEQYFHNITTNSNNYAQFLWSAKEAIYKLIPEERPSIIEDITIPQQPLNNSGTATATARYNGADNAISLNYLFNSSYIVVIAHK